MYLYKKNLNSFILQVITQNRVLQIVLFWNKLYLYIIEVVVLKQYVWGGRLIVMHAACAQACRHVASWAGCVRAVGAARPPTQTHSQSSARCDVERTTY